MKRFFIGLFVSASLSTYSQTPPPAATMAAPFDFPMTLSGNFGELRNNHFHSGLDFKTGGVSGKPVLALMNGYIARARVTHGSGYVLHVVYENGYTTVLRHLSGFCGTLAEKIKRLQYEKENWEVDLELPPTNYPVKSGERIALSGDMGYSFGPHLHLEMIETETGDYVDPLPYFAHYIKDTTPPRVIDVKVEAHGTEGKVSHRNEVWGKVGVSIKAFDYMNGTGNRYGVYSIELAVDGRETFSYKLDRFNSDENEAYSRWVQNSYVRCHLPDSFSLRVLNADQDKGYIRVNEERDYHLVFTLKDHYGNTTRHRYTLHGRRQELPSTLQLADMDTTKVTDSFADIKLKELKESMMQKPVEINDIYPPVVIALAPNTWTSRKRIAFKLKERPASYRGTIDGKYALFGMENLLRKELIYHFDPNRLERGKVHQLELRVSDKAGNETVVRRAFRY